MKRRPANKIPISARAVIQRINRKLQENDQVLKKARDPEIFISSGWPRLGEYYLVNIRHGGIDAADCDLEDLGRELKVLHEWECLAEED